MISLLSILYPAVAVGGIGVIFGFGLGWAGEVLKVAGNEKAGQIREVLPGANCGGCGFAGCDAFAAAVVDGKAAPTACSVGGAKVVAEISAILGIESTGFVKKVAFIKCAGNDSAAASVYNYEGVQDCTAAGMLSGGGHKACRYGCLGHGSCVRACPFGAIEIRGGIAVIDPKKCSACGSCLKVCPRNLIEIIPEEKTTRVMCASKDSGKITKGNCSVGCIGCKLCQKSCEYSAITVSDNVATIDYEKCTLCGACAVKCPVKAITERK
jgi:Na+-translocating ferredoxin:NAD+ oxidoreductase RNF subunit RnfB